MRRLIVLIALSAVLMPVGIHADDFTELQLNSGIRSSEVASYLLLQDARADRSSADRLLGRAQFYAPDLPALQFERARSRFSFSSKGFLDSIDHTVAGLSAYTRNFWWAFSLTGSAFFALVCSFVAALAVVAAIRITIDLPLIAHEIEESRQNSLLLLGLIVLSLISPLLFLGGILVLLGLYMSRTGKAVVYFFLLVLAVSPLLFRVASQFLHVASSGTMKAVVEVNESKGNAYALSTLGSSEDAAPLFSYGLALKRTGRYDEAISAYRTLLKARAGAAAAINLGNAYLGLNRMDEAARQYLEAVSIKPLASAYYNLSQVSREGLDFEKGNEYFTKALATDRNAVMLYRTMYGRNPNRIVADETLDQQALWEAAWAMPGRTATFNLTALPVWALSPAALLLMAAFYMITLHAGNKAYRCRRCNGIFCPHCEKHVMWGQMCPQCFRTLIKLEETEVKERVAQLLSIYEHQKRRRNIMRLLSFVLPGSSQIYGGKILNGILLVWPFLFLLFFPAAASFFPPDAKGSHWVLDIAALSAAAVLMVISNIFTRRRVSKGWL